MRRVSVAIVAAAISLAAPSFAHTAGLGRLSVLSSLGAPLLAEIELVSMQPGEEDNLTARIASAEAYSQAGIEPSAALYGVRFAMARRDGRPVIRVTSPQPVNDPFLDLLVELEWSGGRLVREYTVLLDPPEFKGPNTIAAAPPLPSGPAAQPLPPMQSEPPEPQVRAVALPGDTVAAAPVAEAPAEKPATAGRSAAGSTYEVKRGDTLGAIARAHLPPGVTLNQMLVAIYRANPDAFLRENINLVRAGRILNLPSAEAARQVSVQEANEVVHSHRAEWDEYRSRLAARPAPAEAASRQRAVSGKIAAQPEAAPPAAPQDQVRLSKADPAKPGAGDRAARADDTAARERALKEAQSRVTDLEKNVTDLQKLLEIKNQQLAELEKKAAAKPAAKAEAAKPAPPPVVAEAPKPAPSSSVTAPAASSSVTAPGASSSVTAPGASSSLTAPGASASVTAPGASASVTAPAASAPAAAPAPAPEAKKAEPAKPKPKAVAATPPPPSPPSLLDEFLDNQIALAGLAAIVVLLFGYALWSSRRKKATQAKFSDSVLGVSSGAARAVGGGAAVAAGASGDSVSHTSGMEAEEVDPIAEADVYMAYGRDAQAEEILKEALQKDPNRAPVHAKLVEIYAKRNDASAFEQSALKLKNLTNSSGPEWDKAAALGRSIDPTNSLYGGSTIAAAAVAAAPAFGGFAAEPAAAPTIDFDIGGGTSSGASSADITLDDALKPAAPSSIDFDLGAGSTPPSTGAADSDATVLAPLDFDLNLGGEDKKAAAPALAAAGDSASGLDFDLNLDLGGDKPALTDQTAAPAIDLSSISLDLGAPTEAAGAASSNDPKWQEVATKLDLAKAYEEMGDKDGARELLSEVMKDGDAAQKGQAEQLLTKLG